MMLPRDDLWLAAHRMIERFGDHASKQANALCFEAHDTGDDDAAKSWMAISNAIFSLRSLKKSEGEVAH
jgi:hypothetical protein